MNISRIRFDRQLRTSLLYRLSTMLEFDYHIVAVFVDVVLVKRQELSYLI